MSSTISSSKAMQPTRHHWIKQSSSMLTRSRHQISSMPMIFLELLLLHKRSHLRSRSKLTCKHTSTLSPPLMPMLSLVKQQLVGIHLWAFQAMRACSLAAHRLPGTTPSRMLQLLRMVVQSLIHSRLVNTITQSKSISQRVACLGMSLRIRAACLGARLRMRAHSFLHPRQLLMMGMFRTFLGLRRRCLIFLGLVAMHLVALVRIMRPLFSTHLLLILPPPPALPSITAMSSSSSRTSSTMGMSNRCTLLMRKTTANLQCKTTASLSRQIMASLPRKITASLPRKITASLLHKITDRLLRKIMDRRKPIRSLCLLHSLVHGMVRHQQKMTLLHRLGSNSNNNINMEEKRMAVTMV
mmetsp:Transcript_59569/g.96385  ORF Transcript_59569/g.96385 Transcript_59569/m.96385 type:complete len:355 (+) Transcript_59569:1252-2316(+)